MKTEEVKCRYAGIDSMELHFIKWSVRVIANS